MELLIGVSVFFFTVLLMYSAHLLVTKMYRSDRKKARKRLRMLSTDGRGSAVNILKQNNLSQIPWLNRLLLRASFTERIERLHRQANTPYPLGAFILLSVLLFVGGLLLAAALKMNLRAMALPSLLLSAAPFIFLLYKKRQRMQKFERQLPEALELVARSLKAGHAFTGGLKMVADEFKDPIGTEFKNLLDEIMYGVDVHDALGNLTKRVDCEDLKFFVVSIIIQRETGGNLVEILENLSSLIRERFKFHGRVRALSAEGRLSAIVLGALPFFVAGFLALTKPNYIGVLFTDRLGHIFITLALIMMSIGVMIMKKMVSIKA